MTARERQTAIAALHATIASAETALVALGALSADDAITTDDSDAGCTHPIEHRDELTTMGGPLEWRCRACGFHSTTTDSEG